MDLDYLLRGGINHFHLKVLFPRYREYFSVILFNYY